MRVKIPIYMGLVLLLLSPIHGVLAGGNIQTGIALFDQTNYQKAYEYFEDIELENKNNPEYHYYYGLSLYKTDQAKDAVEAMKRAVELEPQNPDYQFALALIYLLRVGEVNVFRKPGMFGKLKKSMIQAAEHEPTYLPGYLFYTGWLLYAPGIGGGDVEKGKKYLEKLKDVSEADWLRLEAGLANRDENYAKAEELYLKSIEMEPSPRSFISIARYYLERKQYDQAISYADSFNRLSKRWSDPGDSDGHLVLSEAYYYLGDKANFEAHSEKAISMSENEAQKERFETSLGELGD